MKRILLLLLGGLLALTVACGSPDASAPADAGAETPAETAPSDGAAADSAAGDAALTAEEQIELVQGLIDAPVDELYEAIGQPADSAYASSCLGEGEDGELYYDGFTVYTYRDTDGSESVYDVMPAAGSGS